MASTKDQFQALVDTATTHKLPLGMVNEVIVENDTSVKYDENGPRYFDEVVGDNWIGLTKGYLNASLDKLGYLKDIASGVPSPIPTTEFWPVMYQANSLYNEVFHAWWDQILDYSYDSILELIKSKYASRYSGNMEALQECWSETADTYIEVMIENAMRPFEFVWSPLGIDKIKMIRLKNKDFGKKATPLDYAHTKNQVLHSHRFGSTLAAVWISSNEWDVLIKALKTGASSLKVSDIK